MATKARNPRILTAIAFLGIGFFWIHLPLTGGGRIHLLAPGVVSIITALLLLTRSLEGIRSLLTVPASIYNLIFLAYQAYASLLLLQAGLALYASVSFILYGLGALVFLAITLLFYSRQELFTASPSPSSEDSRRGSR